MTVVKAWDDSNDKDGIRPDEITVVLVKNGEATDQTITLNAENNWEASFTDLDVYSQGVAIEYTVEEVSVDGYTSEITGSMAEGFVITNTHTPEETPETPTEPTTPSAPEENTPSETTTPTATTETTPSTSTTETSTSDTTTETVETTVKTGDMIMDCIVICIRLWNCSL
ncbi:MAG: Cna B-type domain-containing protein [Erysipelotrichaceae bacterium]|nr:Cna B-type domain-containing protein [Erysipelotrichaceae bacterium]